MLKNILILFLLIVFKVAHGQQLPFSKCEIQGEDVYVVFNDSCIDSESEACLALADFKRYNLGSVIKSGLISLWEKDGWTLKKTGPNMYQLHKKLVQFDRTFSLEDKFSIDHSFWNFPLSERLKSNENEIKAETVKVQANGNVSFKLKGHKNAKEVILTGSFNQWNEKSIKMVRSGSDWKIRLKMPPGIYEYKFIVDGHWTEDPENAFKVENQHGTYNSILSVGKEVLFSLGGYIHAKNVALSGSFNNWDHKGLKLKKTESGWQVFQTLPAGKHFYKFIIDGKQWIIDPTNDLTERDENNNLNSVLVIH